MSVHAIGGLSSHTAFAPLTASAKPESTEVRGAPDHDGDSDDSGKAAASSSRLVDIHA